MQHSDHYDGKVFHNLNRAKQHGAKEVLRWVRNRDRQPWPKYSKATTWQKVPSVVNQGIHVTFVNHSTVLLQIAGLNILTDPIWSARCSPVQFAGPKRVQDPGVLFDDLPKIDLVLISHNHYDHFDSATVTRLVNKHNPHFMMGIGNENLIKKHNIEKVTFLDWWQKKELNSLSVTFVPAQHFSGRTLFDRDKSLWGGFVIDTSAGKIFFAGDSGYSPHFRDIYARLGAPRLSLLPIGAYEPRWFMSHVHMDPKEAVQAHLDLESELSMGIHFGTFRLTDESIDAPKIELLKSLAEYGLDDKIFWVPQFGESKFIGV